MVVHEPTIKKPTNPIAKSFSVDGLVYDAKQACVEIQNAKFDIGIGAAIVFCRCVWNGCDAETTMKTTMSAIVKSGAFIAVRTVAMNELAKTKFDSIAKDLLGLKNAPSAGEFFSRAEAFNTAVTLVVMTGPDFYDYFSGNMSLLQLFKNTANAAASVAGGTAGAKIGASVGTLISPGLGTSIGGAVGAGIGSMLGCSVSNALLDFIEEDAPRMECILNKTVASLAEDFMLSKEECDLLMQEFKDTDRSNYLKEIYSDNEEETKSSVCRTFVPIMQALASIRPSVTLLNESDLRNIENVQIPEIPEKDNYAALCKKQNSINENINKLYDSQKIAESYKNGLERKKKLLVDAIEFYPIGFLFGAIVFGICKFLGLGVISQITFHTMLLFPIVAIVDNVVFNSDRYDEKCMKDVLYWPAIAMSYITSLFLAASMLWLPVGLVMRLFFGLSKETFWHVPTMIGLVALIPGAITWLLFLGCRLGYNSRYKKAEQHCRNIQERLQKTEKQLEEVKYNIGNIRRRIHEQSLKFSMEYMEYDYKEYDADDEKEEAVPIEYEDGAELSMS